MYIDINCFADVYTIRARRLEGLKPGGGYNHEADISDGENFSLPILGFVNLKKRRFLMCVCVCVCARASLYVVRCEIQSEYEAFTMRAVVKSTV